MRLTLGFSPCPNDTFIFDALVNKKIDTDGLDFDIVLEDVQTLNQWAIEDKLQITKISYGVLPLVLEKYDLLDAGGALGKGVGPLLISKKLINNSDINNCSIAIPGRNTTAHLLFLLAFPEAVNKHFMIFSGIEDAVLSGKTDCGVIIHENRFTYQDKGLVKLVDLGEYWERETGCPIPLGGIVVQKSINATLQKKINDLIRQSIEYAFDKYPFLPDFVKNNSQEMEEHIMRQHIDLYVNNYSLTLGDEGKKAVKTLLNVYSKMNSAEQTPVLSFLS
jgi:1,4-dihydroxy-6-naphthoate synthase